MNSPERNIHSAVSSDTEDMSSPMRPTKIGHGSGVHSPQIRMLTQSSKDILVKHQNNQQALNINHE